MKTKQILIPLFVALLISATNLHSQTIILTKDQIPEKIQKYVEAHFSGKTIVEAEQEFDNGGKKYEVQLQDDTEIEFNDEMEAVVIESNTVLPSSIVPKAIETYVSENYKDTYIVKLEHEKNKIEIELSNDIELIFNQKGEFIRIDK